jgi:hypothetical protein
MSYLNGPRLVFAGRFQADVSTVNNTHDNFNTNCRRLSAIPPGILAARGFSVSSLAWSRPESTPTVRVRPAIPRLGWRLATAARERPPSSSISTRINKTAHRSGGDGFTLVVQETPWRLPVRSKSRRSATSGCARREASAAMESMARSGNRC